MTTQEKGPTQMTAPNTQTTTATTAAAAPRPSTMTPAQRREGHR